MTPEQAISTSLGLFSITCCLIAIYLRLGEIHSTLKEGAK